MLPIAAIAVLATLSSKASAQSSPENSTIVAGAETVTITGTRNPTSAFDYPGMVDVLDLDDILSSVPSTIGDLVQDMPNVQFGGGPRRTGEDPNIRGFTGQDVLILVDGVRQSWASMHDGRFFLDPSLLAGVEVLRGPASALYGSGALGGVLAFRTANASDFLGDGETAGARVSLGYQGVNDEFLRNLTAYTQVGNFDLIGSIGERTSGDIKLGSGDELPADDDIVTGFAKASYSSDEFNAAISYQGFRNDVIEPDNGQGVGTGPTVDKAVKSEQVAGHFEWTPAGAPFIALHFTPYHIEGSVKEADPITGNVAARDIETNGFSADNRTHFSLGSVSGLFTFGGEWYDDEQVGRDNAGAGGTRSGVPDGQDSFWGVFAQIEASVERPLGAPGKFSIIPAIRYDSYSASSTDNPDVGETAVSPKLAANYAPTDWLFFFGNVGRAFRAPGINELYLSGIHFEAPHPILPGIAVANTFEPNPNLKPETSKYWEAGTGLSFHDVLWPGDTLRAKASYWRQNVDDFISLVIFIPPTFYSLGCFTPPTFLVNCNLGTATATNVNAELHGAEFESVYDNERVRLAVNYGAISGRERGTPYDLQSLIPDLLDVVATLKLPEVDGSISARVQNAGSFHKTYNPIISDVPDDRRSGYTVVDVFATWQPGETIFGGRLQGLRIDVGVDNIGDQDYEPFQQGVSAPGRNFKALASYALGW
jgi:hemoglobin/transferrin/lactoferrin receptor protein